MRISATDLVDYVLHTKRVGCLDYFRRGLFPVLSKVLRTTILTCERYARI